MTYVKVSPSNMIKMNYHSFAGPYFFQSKADPLLFIGSDNDFDMVLTSHNKTKFYLTPALNGQKDMVSFEAADKPGYFLRHYIYWLFLEPKNGGRNLPVFNNDATFRAIRDPNLNGYYSFLSYNMLNYYISHEEFRMKMTVKEETEEYANSTTFKLLIAT